MKFKPLFKKTGSILDRLTSFFGGGQEEMHRIPLITYEEVINYFVVNQNKAENLDAVRGALFKENKKNGILVYLFYMDKSDNILSGKKFFTEAFTQELSEALGEKDLLIFE